MLNPSQCTRLFMYSLDSRLMQATQWNEYIYVLCLYAFANISSETRKMFATKFQIEIKK